MNFPFYIAKRYLKSKSGNNIINIVTILATLGVATGTLALLLVLSVFSGIKQYSTNLLDITTPEVRIQPKKGKTFIYSDSINSILENCPERIIYSKIIEEKSFFRNVEKKKEKIAYIQGVDTNYSKIIAIDSIMYVGNWLHEQSYNSCVVGYNLALDLELNTYSDLLSIYVPKVGKGYTTNLKNAFSTVNPQVVGVSNISSNTDTKYVFIPLKLAQHLLDLKPNEISHVDIRTDFQEATIEYLKQQLPEYNILSDKEINSEFYKIVNSENLIAYLVSVLIVIMVLSNTIGTIIMVIVDKRSHIKTLLNIGSTIKDIQRIYRIYGFLLNITGMFIGIVIGSILILVQKIFSPFMISANTPYPIVFNWGNLFLVIDTISLLGFISSYLASSRISKRLFK